MLITATTCFLLGPSLLHRNRSAADDTGTTFTHWIADHDVLWRMPLTPEAIHIAIQYYSLLSAAPRGMSTTYLAMVLLALGSAGGRLVKGWSYRSGEVLFDGGSVGELLVCARGS